MNGTKSFHPFPRLPAELRLTIWESLLTAGFVIGVERIAITSDIAYSSLNPLNWDVSIALGQLCQEARRLIQKRYERIELSNRVHYISPERTVHWVDFSRTTFHFDEEDLEDADVTTQFYRIQSGDYDTRLQYASINFSTLGSCAMFCRCIAEQFISLKAIFIFASTGATYCNIPPEELLEYVDDDEPLPDSVLAAFRGVLVAMPKRVDMSNALGMLFGMRNPDAYRAGSPRIIVLP